MSEPQPTRNVQPDETGNPALREAYKALDAIEWITADDFVEDLEMQIAFRSDEIPPNLVIAVEKLCKIYAIAHAESPNHSCHDVHNDWRKIKNEVLASKANSERPVSSASTKPTGTTEEKNLVGKTQSTKGEATRGD